MGVVVCLVLLASACGGSSETVETTTTVASTTTTTVASTTTTTVAPTTTVVPSTTEVPDMQVAPNTTVIPSITEAPVLTFDLSETEVSVVDGIENSSSKELPGETELVKDHQPGCSDIPRRQPSFEAGIAKHELWIGRVAGDVIIDQKMLGQGFSVADGLMIDGKPHLWMMAASDHVLHHAIIDRGNFIDLGPISIDGDIFQGVIDPDIFLLPDGSFGLVAVNGTNRKAGPICLFKSYDGQNFETIRIVLDEIGVQDPSVVILDDWVMAVKTVDKQEIRVLIGNPDKGFIEMHTLEGGDPDLTISKEGTLKLTVCSEGMLIVYSSTTGNSWEFHKRIRSQTCGPATISGSNLILHLPKPGQGGAIEVLEGPSQPAPSITTSVN